MLCCLFGPVLLFAGVSFLFRSHLSPPPPLHLYSYLHDLFSRFDELAARFGVNKIETVG